MKFNRNIIISSSKHVIKLHLNPMLVNTVLKILTLTEINWKVNLSQILNGHGSNDINSL